MRRPLYSALKWSRFSRTDARDARLKLAKLSGNPRNWQFVRGANTSTKVLPPRIRRGIRRVPRYNCSANSRGCSIKIRARSSQRQLESKFRRIMKLTRTTTLPTGSVAFICISRRETIVRAFGAQHALETTLVCAATTKRRKSGSTLTILGVPDLSHFISARKRDRDEIINYIISLYIIFNFTLLYLIPLFFPIEIITLKNYLNVFLTICYKLLARKTNAIYISAAS